jgi:hypothetical protein
VAILALFRFLPLGIKPPDLTHLYTFFNLKHEEHEDHENQKTILFLRALHVLRGYRINNL